MNFSEDFFQDEYRFGFLIPELMKRAWAAEMEILEIVINICEKYHLQYYAYYGTLLGAVRHKGFIPWDDDIDICLKRRDYNTLITVLPKELPEGFILGGLHATDAALRYHAGVGQSSVRTDANYWSIPDYIKRFHGFPFPGTSIDIYPLDYIPRDPDMAFLQKNLITDILTLLHNYTVLPQYALEARLAAIEKNTAVTLPRDETLQWALLNLAEKLASMFDESECEELDYFLYLGNDSRSFRSKEWYNKAVSLPFEGTYLDVPVSYHEVLTSYYGDYKTPVRLTQGHSYPFYANAEQTLKETLAKSGFSGSISDFIKNIDSFNILDSKHE